MEKKIPVRSEADPKYTWALEDVYANNDVWKADLEKAISDSVAEKVGAQPMPHLFSTL